MKRALAAVLVCAVAACERKQPPDDVPAWPRLERSQALKVLGEEIKRAPDDGAIAPDFAGLPDVIEHDAKAGNAIAGWDAIDAWLEQRIVDHPEKNLLFLFGTDHDAPEQIDAFRRLVGPQARVPWTRIVVEQLRADGHWKTYDPLDQSGDDRALARYMETGTRADLAAILAAQERDVYTTWKFGAGDALADLLAAARASSRPVGGCDINPAIREYVGFQDSALRRFRELHCWLALRDALAKRRGPHRVAMLWGHTHLDKSGFLQLVPPDWEVVLLHAAGRRQFVGSLERDLDDRAISVVDPLVVGNNALVLPTAGRSSASLERARDTSATRKSSQVAVLEDVPIDVRIDGRPFKDGSPAVTPGRHVLWVELAKKKLVAGFELRPNEHIQILASTTFGVDISLIVIAPGPPKP